MKLKQLRLMKQDAVKRQQWKEVERINTMLKFIPLDERGIL